MTHEEAIKHMTTKQLAQYLFERGNCDEYCYGICAAQKECDYDKTENECIENVCKWLLQEQDHE